MNDTMFQRYKHEVIVALLTLLIASVIALLVIVVRQGVYTQQLLQEMADQSFTDI